jgi:hypothetical protein
MRGVYRGERKGLKAWRRFSRVCLVEGRRRAEVERFEQLLFIECSRRSGGAPGVLDAQEAALYPEGIGRAPSGGPVEA